MSGVFQTVSYIAEAAFLLIFIIFIIVCAARLVKSRSIYDASQDELLIELRCLTVAKKHWFGQTNVELKPGTYAIGISAFSELRIKDTGVHFAGMLEVYDTGVCHLYINSGSLTVRDRIVGEKTSGYIVLSPGDVFSIGSQTLMINRLTRQYPAAQ